MSEITKLYENAGIGKTLTEAHCLRCWYGTCVLSEKECKKTNKQKCKDFKGRIINGDHPPFTAEKQIAILMFILNKFGDIGFQKMYSIRGNDENTRKDFIKCLCDCEHETLDSRPVDFYYQNGASGDNFEESLAGLINNIWQDLTEKEKQQVKGILE